MIDYGAAGIQAVSDEQLSELALLADTQLRLESELVDMQQDVTAKKRELANVREVAIPTLMDELGMEKFTLADGHGVAVKDEMTASISVENRPKAAAWLAANGLSSLVKQDVIVSFDRGDTERVQRLLALLDDYGEAPYSIKEQMFTGSVKKAIKELLGQGVAVPLELFGAHLRRVSKINQPRG